MMAPSERRQWTTALRAAVESGTGVSPGEAVAVSWLEAESQVLACIAATLSPMRYMGDHCDSRARARSADSSRIPRMKGVGNVGPSLALRYGFWSD